MSLVLICNEEMKMKVVHVGYNFVNKKSMFIYIYIYITFPLKMNVSSWDKIMNNAESIQFYVKKEQNYSMNNNTSN